MKAKKIGFFIGRFQPFHKGHLKDIERILNECDKSIIGIGSSQEMRTKNNPFSFVQRKKIIELALNDKKINRKKYTIISIPDINNDDLWVKYVEKLCPKFDVVYTGNALVKKLFGLAKYKVVDVKIYKNINSSKIRKKILFGEEWKQFVPNKVSKYLDEICAEDLIKKINK